MTKYVYTCIILTSAKIIQLNEWGCRDGMHHRGNKEIPLYSNTIKDTSTIMRNPPYIKCREGEGGAPEWGCGDAPHRTGQQQWLLTSQPP